MTAANSTSNERDRALHMALRYLARYPVSSWELARWLRRKNVTPTTIRRVVRYCKKLHYLNDIDALRRRVRAGRRKRWGRARVYQDLRRRGIPLKYAERALQRWYPEPIEQRVFRRWVRRLPPDIAPRVLVQRARGRGFGYATVQRWLEEQQHEQPGDP